MLVLATWKQQANAKQLNKFHNFNYTKQKHFGFLPNSHALPLKIPKLLLIPKEEEFQSSALAMQTSGI